jgi:type I restriction enzyme M protein
MTSQAMKDKLLATLTDVGGSAGNGRLREALGWQC